MQNLKTMELILLQISSNDQINYPEDSFDNMVLFSREHNFGFPYLIDETQNVAKNMMLCVLQIFLDII